MQKITLIINIMDIEISSTRQYKDFCPKVRAEGKPRFLFERYNLSKIIDIG